MDAASERRQIVGRALPRSPRNADYDTLFALTSTPTLEVGPDGEVLAGNKAAGRLLEMNPEHLRGMPLTALLGDDATAALTSSRPVDVTTSIGDDPVRLRLFGTDRELSHTGTPNRIVQVIRREGRGPADAHRRRTAGRMTLVDDISHNLGTPLAIVAGYAETLGERWGELQPTEVASATDAIRRHAQRAVEELRGIQARVRAIDGGSGPVPTAILVAWLRRMLAAPLASTGSIIVERDLPTQVTIDASIARQALLSICQGLLGANQPAAEIVVEASTSDDGTTFTLTGVDFGELRPDHLDMLAVTRSVVVDGGGRYQVDDAGRVHTLQLPARSRAAATPRRIPVAIIEDDPDAAALVRASLRSLASVFEVVADERTLRNGLDAVAATKPRILVLDQTLPDGNGTQIVDRVMALSPRTKVVMLSAGNPEEDAATLDDDVRWLHKGKVMADLGSELLAVLAEG